VRSQRLDRLQQLAVAALTLEPFGGCGRLGPLVVVERLVGFASVEGPECLVDGDAVDPAEKSPLRIERVQVLVGLHERELGDVLRLVAIVDHAKRDVVQHALIAIQEMAECTTVARENSFDQLGIADAGVDRADI